MSLPNSDLYARSAAAFQQASRVDRALLMKDAPQSIHFSRPFAGWMGDSYRGETLIVAKNPGGIPRKALAVHDALDHELDLFVSSADPADSMRRVASFYADQDEEVGMNYLLEEVLTALDEKRADVAFANICPFRGTSRNAMRANTISLKCVLAPLLNSLRPDTVV